MLKHFVLALVISFALSVAFWGVFGVFELAPFFIVSLLCAAAGASIGVVFGKRLLVTGIATAVIRVAAFYAVTNL